MAKRRVARPTGGIDPNPATGSAEDMLNTLQQLGNGTPITESGSAEGLSQADYISQIMGEEKNIDQAGQAAQTAGAAGAVNPTAAEETGLANFAIKSDFAAKYAGRAWPTSISQAIKMLKDSGAIGLEEKVRPEAQAAIARLVTKLSKLPIEARATEQGQKLAASTLTMMAETIAGHRNAGASLGKAVQTITRGAGSPEVKGWLARSAQLLTSGEGAMGFMKTMLKGIGGPVGAGLLLIPPLVSALGEKSMNQRIRAAQPIELPSGDRISGAELDSMTAEQVMRRERLKKARLRDMMRTLTGGDVSASNVKGMTMLEGLAGSGGSPQQGGLGVPPMISLPASSGYGS